jgi:hypothetical protein
MNASCGTCPAARLMRLGREVLQGSSPRSSASDLEILFEGCRTGTLQGPEMGLVFTWCSHAGSGLARTSSSGLARKAWSGTTSVSADGLS